MTASATTGGGRLPGAFLLALLIPAGVLGVLAALELRPLHGDGFQYLVRILETELPTLPSPGRRFTEWAMQTPVLIAMAFGATDIGELAQIFSLGHQLLPLTLTALCWPMLPANRKRFMIFPLVHYFAGTCAAALAAIAAGPAPSAAFWLMLFFILFRMPGTRTIDIALLAAPCAFALHESIVFLGPLLAFAALVRARGMAQRGDRLALYVLAALFLAAAAVQGYYIARPAHAGHGASQLRGLLNGDWLVGAQGQVNLLAVIGTAGLLVLAGLWLTDGRRPARAGWMVVAAYGAATLAAAAWLYAADRTFAPGAQFTARNNSTLISLPLGVAAIAMATVPLRMSAAFVRQSAAIVGMMAAIALTWDFYATQRWSHYIAVVRGILAENRGFVEWQAALNLLPVEDRRLLQSLAPSWTIPQISIVLSPKDGVKSMLGIGGPAVGWPYEPRNPATLPRSRFWNLSQYLDAVAEPAVDLNSR